MLLKQVCFLQFLELNKYVTFYDTVKMLKKISFKILRDKNQND